MAALLEAYRSGPYDTASDSDENVNEEDEIDRISERSSPLPISLTPTQVDNPISDQVLDPTVIRTEEPVLEETSTDLSPPNLPRLEDSATDQVPSDTIVVRLPPAPPKLTDRTDTNRSKKFAPQFDSRRTGRCVCERFTFNTNKYSDR